MAAKALTAVMQWCIVTDQIRPKVPNLAMIKENAEDDVLPCMPLPGEHRAKLRSTNPIKGPTHVIGIFPNDEATAQLIGALPLAQKDEGAVQRARCITLETVALQRRVPCGRVQCLAPLRVRSARPSHQCRWIQNMDPLRRCVHPGGGFGARSFCSAWSNGDGNAPNRGAMVWPRRVAMLNLKSVRRSGSARPVACGI